MESDFKAGLRIAGMVLLTVGIAIVVLWSLGGFVCASAESLTYSTDFVWSNLSTFTYNVNHTQYKSSSAAVAIQWMTFNDIQNFKGVKQVVMVCDADLANYGNTLQQFMESDIKIHPAGTIIGHVLHGYTIGGGKCHYVMYFHDYDFSGLSGGKYVIIDTPLGMTFDDVTATSANDRSGIASGDFAFCTENGVYHFANAYDYTWDADHYYEKWCDYQFKNEIRVYNMGGYYKISVNRSGLGGSWLGSSKLHIYDSLYTYVNETSYSDSNVNYYCFDGSICDWVYFSCVDQQTGPGGGRQYSDNATGVCDLPEPGYFDLSGYTRSVEGNIIPGVLLTARDKNAYSNNISFYEFENLETGSFNLAWNKTGYHNDSISRYIGTPGDYQIDVYMIPLSSLDAGEFGGVVYDYCTLKTLQGAYVYLFNETADSGNYAYTNKYGFYRFAGMTEGMEYEVSATKDGYEASLVHSFTFNESNINETHCKTKNIWLLPEGGCPDDGGIPTPPPAPTPTPHEWTNEEIVSQLRILVPSLFFIVLFVTFMWFLRKAGGAKR